MSEVLTRSIVDALKSVTSPRFFETERGFQGRFQVLLDRILRSRKIISDETIIEEEYQKTIPNHGFKHRPDLIIHIPFETGLTENRREGNFVVFEFALRASEQKAIDCFDKLDDYISILNYPLGIFVNISDNRSFINCTQNEAIHVFNAVKTEDEVKVFHSYLLDGQEIVNEF